MDTNFQLGIDVGGSGIKGAIVDLSTGDLVTERLRIETPKPATPEAMAEVVRQICERLEWKGESVGVGFPAIVRQGVAHSAANIHDSWVGTNIETTFSEAIGRKVFAVNDADAAGLAAMEFGVGRGEQGTVVLITIGSGLGSALFTDGHLVRNTEFGHFYMEEAHGVAEIYASGRARKRDGISWEEWGGRFNIYLHHLDRLISPDLILLGGGGSKKFEKYAAQLDVQTRIKPAQLGNMAGIVGAAHYARQMEKGGLL
jgi:polyphosphate glucokinase